MAQVLWRKWAPLPFSLQEAEPQQPPFPSARLTFVETAADLHGWLPLSILTGQVLVVAFQHVAFGTQVLNDAARVQGVSARPGVADVATILWLWGQRTHCKKTERVHGATVLRFSSGNPFRDGEPDSSTGGTKSHSLGKAVGQTQEIQVAKDTGKHAGHREKVWLLATLPLSLGTCLERTVSMKKL